MESFARHLARISPGLNTFKTFSYLPKHLRMKIWTVVAHKDPEILCITGKSEIFFTRNATPYYLDQKSHETSFAIVESELGHTTLQDAFCHFPGVLQRHPGHIFFGQCIEKYSTDSE